VTFIPLVHCMPSLYHALFKQYNHLVPIYAQFCYQVYDWDLIRQDQDTYLVFIFKSLLEGKDLGFSSWLRLKVVMNTFREVIRE
jgi:hypothetical protein